MSKPRGRPPGTTGRAAVLSSAQVKQALRVARSRGRHGARAEAALVVSLALGLRAKELAALKWADVYDDKGRVRAVVHLKTAYTKGGKTRDVFVSSPTLRRVLEKYGDRDSLLRLIASGAALFGSQKGGAMTAPRGRRPGRVVAQRQAHADHAARRARDRPEGDRADRRPHFDPHDRPLH
jgi:integrase